jgi:hypothetical protein
MATTLLPTPALLVPTALAIRPDAAMVSSELVWKNVIHQTNLAAPETSVVVSARVADRHGFIQPDAPKEEPQENSAAKGGSNVGMTAMSVNYLLCI